MTILLTGFVALTIVMILSGTLVPRCELDAVMAVRELQTSAPGPVVDYDLAYGIRTQAEILDRLPQWMRSEFDCSAGPHSYMPRVTARGNNYEWCCHCNRMKRTVDPWPDTERDPLEVIYDLQFRRR